MDERQIDEWVRERADALVPKGGKETESFAVWMSISVTRRGRLFLDAAALVAEGRLMADRQDQATD